MLNISFYKRPIYKAPTEVLQHLYYYTAQYGLSVAQFTGKHQDYWAKLPSRLHAAQYNPEKLNHIIEELEKLAEGANYRLRKRREQKDKKWAEKEIVLNAQLLSVLAAFPKKLLANGFKELMIPKYLPESIQIVDVSFKNKDGSDAFVFVEPDILLLGNNHLLMVELKTRGWATSTRKYPPNQLLNYFRLIAECQDSKDNTLPTSFSHLILVPSSDQKWLENSSKWIIETCNAEEGRLVVDPDNCIKYGRGKSSYNHERVRDLLNNIPIFYRSWDQLETAFKNAINKYNDKRHIDHWMDICQELTDLAIIAGKYK